MTTRVMVINFGTEKNVELEIRSNHLDAKKSTVVETFVTIFPLSTKEVYLHDGNYIVLKEVPKKDTSS